MNCKFHGSLHRTNLFLLAAAVILVTASSGKADPADQDFFTNFESINTAVGTPFDVGSGDTIVTFSGDAFSGVVGVGQLYHSGTHSWMVTAPGTGTITFSTNASVVEFFGRTRSFANGNTVITAFDDDNAVVGDPIILSPPNEFELVSFTGSIDHIVFENLATGGNSMFNGIDDFGFTPIDIVALPGDFDADGDVDGNDFLAWQTGFGIPTGATLADGDADGDGDVDGNDFLAWQSNFGSSAGAASGVSPADVPEPAAAGLLLLTCLGMGAVARARPC